MSAIPQQDFSQRVSERILDPLRQVEDRHWALRVMRGLLQVMIVALGAWMLVAIVLGIWPETPLWVRFILAGAAWVATVHAIFKFMVPTFQKRNISQAAAQVEAACPEMQERISSAVELAGETDQRFLGSRELIGHLIVQAEADAQNVDPQTVVSSKNLKRWFAYFAIFPIVWLFLLVFSHGMVMRGLYSGLAPWTTTVPNLLANMDVSPGSTNIPQGDSLEINVAIPYGNFDDKRVRHASVVCTFVGGRKIASDLDMIADRTHMDAPQKFHTFLDNLQQDFVYQVSTDRGDSAAYTVHVLPRPAITGIDVHYTYPAYTNIPDKDEAGKDGAIEALVGTKVKLTVHSSLPLADDKSFLAIAENTSNSLNVPLRGIGGDAYEGTVLVTRTAPYRIHLENAEGLENKDTVARTINAKIDAPPTVQIISPPAITKVRPDDVIPVTFKVADDFGLTAVQAVVSVDDRLAETADVPLNLAGTLSTTGTFQLSVKDQLAKKIMNSASKIDYQIKVVDNREPEHQVTFSARQTLILDNNVDSFAARAEAAAILSLSQAIRGAIENVSAMQPPAAGLAAIDATRALTAEERQAAQRGQDALVKTAKDLSVAAAGNMNGPFASISGKAQEIADGSLKGSADGMARVALASDQPQPRKAAADDAVAQLAAAKTDLQALLDQLTSEAKVKAQARDLADLARQQKELADKLALKPNDPNLLKQQQELMKKTQEQIAREKEFQKPEIQQVASEKESLAQDISKVAQEQKQEQEKIDDAHSAADAEKKLADLQKEQDQLNKDIKQFEKNQQSPLKNAFAPAPTPQQLDAIANNMKNNQIPAAVDQQNKAAQQLTQASQKMDDQANKADPSNNPAVAQAKQQEDQAAKLEDKAQQLADHIAEATALGKRPTRPSAPANHEATALAAAIKQQANKMEEKAKKKSDAQAALDQAKQEANEAQQDAQQGQAEEAQQHLAKAAADLKDAAVAEQDQAKAQTQAGEEQQAADEAQKLADRQQELAQETADAQKQMAKGPSDQQPNHEQTAQEQNAIAHHAQDAAAQAQKLQQQTQATAPEVAQQAQAAADNMQKAAQEAAQAASSERQGNEPQAQQEQGAAEQSMNKAEQALRNAGENQPEQVANAEQPKSDQPNNEANPEGQHQAEAEGQHQGEPEQGHQAEQGAHEGEQPKSGQQGEPGHEQGNEPGQQAGGQEPGGQQPGQQPGQKPGGQQPGQGQAGQGGKGQQTAQQLMNQAAQAVQQAYQAQHSATQGQAGAAEQAAQNLDNASNAMAQMVPSSDGGQDQGPTQHSTNPSMAMVSHARAGPSGAMSDARPKSVQDIGISASDWANLPAKTQSELLNAAQQSGPPAYREMIKNYYVRIAKLESDGGSAQ